MTVVPIFPEIYFHYKVQNHQQFKKYLLSNYSSDPAESPSNWNCNVKSLSIDANDIVPYLTPVLKEFCKELDKKLNFFVKDSWLNFYNQNDFQEIHGHSADAQLSMVYFVNYNPVTDGKFYFFNRNYTDRELSKFSTLIDKFQAVMSNWYPNIEEGDILIFPSYLLHGVRPHESNTQRITLAVNFTFEVTPYEL